MELDAGLREMIASIRAALPDMGLKKLTALFNESLPPEIQVEKYVVRDFIRELEKTKTDDSAATKKDVNEKGATEPGACTTAVMKPRDEAFKDATKQVYIAFRDGERDYLMGIVNELRDQMHMTDQNDHWATCILGYLRHHVQVLLTLKGLKPCTLFFLGNANALAARAANGIILKHLFPLLERHDIESYGFKLQYIATQIKADADHDTFRGAWVLADMHSEKWPKVADTFFKSRPEGPDVFERDIALVQGYPIAHCSKMEETVVFEDVTECNYLRETYEVLCRCVVALEFDCGDGDFAEYAAIREFFNQCHAVADEVGTKLTLNLDDHKCMKKCADYLVSKNFQI